jgi:hypothetical protein
MSPPQSSSLPCLSGQFQSMKGWLRFSHALINGQAALSEGSAVSIRCSQFFRPFSRHGLRGADVGMGVCLKCHGMAKDALSDFP